MNIPVNCQTPVDKQASKVLWKAPWWALYPEPAKMAIREVEKKHSWEAWIDFTKAPPVKNGGTQITDLRGKKFSVDLFKKTPIGREKVGEVEATIVGYSRISKNPTGTSRSQCWWAKIGKEIVEIWRGSNSQKSWRLTKAEDDSELMNP
jgi:hypothetical protein